MNVFGFCLCLFFVPKNVRYVLCMYPVYCGLGLVLFCGNSHK